MIARVLLLAAVIAALLVPATASADVIGQVVREIKVVGNEKVEAQERDVTIRVEARANIVRNALIIGGVIALVVGVAVASIRVSRR